jgi:hypothetical protein
VSTLVLPAPFVCTERQQELADAWYGPAKEVLAAGAVRSGKTQAAARLLVEDALSRPCVYVVARMTYQELRDSTQAAMLRGDGSLPPLIPLEARDYTYGTQGFHGTENAVRLVNGAEIRFRNLEHAHTWLNVAYGGIMVDQAEEMDEGPEGERLYDTILTRLSDPRGRRKVLLVANPASELHWLWRRFVGPDRHASTANVRFTLGDNAPNLPADLIASLEALKTSRPHFYRCFVLGEWGAFEGAAYQEWSDDVHVVAGFAIPNGWQRVEAMDHGVNNPTCWLWAALDYDGNLIIFDEYHQPGLVSAHAAEVWRRRRAGHWAKDDTGGLQHATCFADPSVKNRWGKVDINGRELSVETEYADHGIGLSMGQNNRHEGYARILELIHPDPERLYPDWHPRHGQPGSPRLFAFARCENLARQIRSAPVKPEGKDALDTVDPDWETQHGHANACLRYLVLGRLGPSTDPRLQLDDRQWHEARMLAKPLYEDGFDVTYAP